jgi:preprotein translocase subunit YajC
MPSSSVLVRSFVALSAPADANASPWLSLLPFVIILGIFYVMVLMPMKKRQQKVAAFQDSLKVGDKIVTTGGIYGTITRLSERHVQLQIAPQVRIDVARAAVGGLQGQDPVVVPDQGAS